MRAAACSSTTRGPRAPSRTSPPPTCSGARGSSGSRTAWSSSGPPPRGVRPGSRRSRRTCRESRSTPTWRRTSRRRFIVRPVWIELAEMAGIIAFPLPLAPVLPVMRPVPSIFTLAVGAALFGGAIRLPARAVDPLVYPRGAAAHSSPSLSIASSPGGSGSTPSAFQQYVSPGSGADRGQPRRCSSAAKWQPHRALLDIRDFTTFTGERPAAGGADARDHRDDGIVIEEGGTRQVHRRRGDGGVRRADSIRPRPGVPAPPCAWPPRWSG